MVEQDDVGHELFEKLIAGFTSDREDIEVRHQYDFALDTGGQKEVDVMVWDNSGNTEEQVMIECKNHSGNLSQGYIDEMAGLLCQSEANRGIVIARTGFQSGAKERARGLQDSDTMRVEPYILRFVSHDPEQDERALKRVLMETGFQPHNPENFNFDLDIVDDDLRRKVESGEVNLVIRWRGHDSPDIYNRDGTLTGQDLGDMWEEKHWEEFAGRSEYGLIERDRVNLSVGIEKDTKISQTLEFNDKYLSFPDGLVRINKISYDMDLSWTTLDDADLSIDELEDDIADLILSHNDMVLIDPLDNNSGYISSDRALELFLGLSEK